MKTIEAANGRLRVEIGATGSFEFRDRGDGRVDLVDTDEAGQAIWTLDGGLLEGLVQIDRVVDVARAIRQTAVSEQAAGERAGRPLLQTQLRTALGL